MSKLKNQILDFSRQNQKEPLTPWFDQKLDDFIADGRFLDTDSLETISQALCNRISNYGDQTPVQTAVLGMSGGVDSALTAALFVKAGWRVIGVTMPIHQVEAETLRGIEACRALGIEHRHLDLSELADLAVHTVAKNHPAIADDPTSVKSRIRRGNIRARTRMIALYDLANAENGLVASTDNLSELGAGFWTINGDVGDYSPIQSLLKSWEVPYLAFLNGVPEPTWRATPTDGLAILEGGDEAQLGCSYLEWDIMIFAIVDAIALASQSLNDVRSHLGISEGGREDNAFYAITARMNKTWFKRFGPIKLPHALHDRYEMIDQIDRTLFIPESVLS